MKETMRTASVLEIYNTKINEFKNEKKDIEKKLSTLKAKGYGRGAWGCFFNGFMVFLTFIGLITLVSGLANDSDSAKASAIIGAFFTVVPLLLVLSNLNKNKKAKEQREKTIEKLTLRLEELTKEIDQYETRKKTLLENEELIIDRDLNNSQSSKTSSNLNNESQDDTKICPMCAETIKKAAVICRFCGYKYE